MKICPLHKYPLVDEVDCAECKRSKEFNSFRLFNEDRSLGQNQYASRYADGRHGCPNLGSDLRWMGNPSDYHDLYIHQDDYDTFHHRVLKHKENA